MSASIFPRRRADGSFAVAIRYAVPDGDAITAIQDGIAGWVEVKAIRDRLDVAGEFARPLSVEPVDPGTVQVVLECRSSAVLWKGLLVELRTALDEIPGLRFMGFWDLVAGEVHPASVPR